MEAAKRKTTAKQGIVGLVIIIGLIAGILAGGKWMLHGINRGLDLLSAEWAIIISGALIAWAIRGLK